MQSGRPPGWPVRWSCHARHTSPAPINTHRTPSSSRGSGFRSVVVEALRSSCCCSSSPAARQALGARPEGMRKQRMCIMSSFGTGSPLANSTRGSKRSWGPSSTLSIASRAGKKRKSNFWPIFPPTGREVTSWDQEAPYLVVIVPKTIHPKLQHALLDSAA